MLIYKRFENIARLNDIKDVYKAARTNEHHAKFSHFVNADEPANET